MIDFSKFNPSSVDDLFNAIVSEGEGALGRPIESGKAVAGHLRLLAAESLKTAAALAEGRIDGQTAKEVLDGRKEALVQIAEFGELLALQAAQRLADGVFRVIGWAIFNRTGINLAPGLVSPKSS